MFGQLSNAQARRPAPGGGHRHRHGHGGNGGGPSILQKWYRGTDSIATSRPTLVEADHLHCQKESCRRSSIRQTFLSVSKKKRFTTQCCETAEQKVTNIRAAATCTSWSRCQRSAGTERTRFCARGPVVSAGTRLSPGVKTFSKTEKARSALDGCSHRRLPSRCQAEAGVKP